MRTRNFDQLSENVLTISEMFNVRGGDGNEEGEEKIITVKTTVGSDEDIII